MRKESNSVTQLVKIIAEEVFEERIKKYNLEPINTNDFVKKVNETIDYKGCPWEEGEDFLFEQEIKAAIAQIAKNHKRSEGAIKSRLKLRIDLLKCT